MVVRVRRTVNVIPWPPKLIQKVNELGKRGRRPSFMDKFVSLTENRSHLTGKMTIWKKSRLFRSNQR